MPLTASGRRDYAAILAKAHGIKNGSLTKALKNELEEELVNLTEERFKTATDPEGEAWPGGTIRGGSLLQDTRTMFGSISQLSSGGKKVGVGITADYAVHHQYGTGIYGKHHRPIKPISAKALAFPLRKNDSKAKGKAGKKVG